jgi:hypothetical protein
VPVAVLLRALEVGAVVAVQVLEDAVLVPQTAVCARLGAPSWTVARVRFCCDEGAAADERREAAEAAGRARWAAALSVEAAGACRASILDAVSAYARAIDAGGAVGGRGRWEEWRRALVVMLDFRIGNARLGAFDWSWRPLHKSMTSPIWMAIYSGEPSDLPAPVFLDAKYVSDRVI